MPARGGSAAIDAVAAVLLVLASSLPASFAQLGGDTLPLPSGPSGACDLSTLGPRLDAWNNACCLAATGDGGVCDATSLLQCSVDCAIQTLPLLHDCRFLLDPVLDETDGTQDGNAYMLDVAFQSCTAIPTSVALDRVESLIHAGTCSLEDANGWGETDVVATCEDVNPNCAAALSMGFPCANLRGQCDMTCTFCGASGAGGTGGHRRRGRRRRRVQDGTTDGTNNNCALSTLQTDFAQVNTICCDDASGVCATGVPATCDVKCAVYFVDLYDRCADFIAVMVGPVMTAQLDSLHTTCAEALPSEELLRLAAQCSADDTTRADGTEGAGLLPSEGQGGVCPLVTLDARVAAVNEHCCVTLGRKGTACGEDSGCTVDCAIVLLPLLRDCRALLDQVYDSLDGVEDGKANFFDGMHTSCLEIPPQDALQRVTELHEAGECPDEELDGVGQTDVGSVVQCADTNPNCEVVIAAGIPCANLVGQCDSTCNFCDRTGRRMLQGSNQLCDQTTVPANIAQISTTCCDDEGGVCDASITPASCDAKCAVFFAPFFASCQDFIHPAVSLATYTSLTHLHTTCATGLPAEDLLLVAAQCANDFPVITRPTFTVTSGPCTVSNDGYCVGRWSHNNNVNYGNNENCRITVNGPGTLGPCQIFDTESCCDKVTIGDRQYSGNSCPEGAVIEEGSSISWHSDGSVTRQGWEICSAE